MIILSKDRPRKQVKEEDLIRHVGLVLSQPEREEKRKQIWSTLKKEMDKRK